MGPSRWCSTSWIARGIHATTFFDPRREVDRPFHEHLDEPRVPGGLRVQGLHHIIANVEPERLTNEPRSFIERQPREGVHAARNPQER